MALFTATLALCVVPHAVIAAERDAIPGKAPACFACHGADGNSTQPAVPSLAGQPAQFIATALLMFHEGNRKDAQMSPIAADLTNAEMNALAAYFAARQPLTTGRPLLPDQRAAARQLTERLNCVQCHGPALHGQQHIPRIAGQHAVYLRTQLRGFKASTRFDLDGVMTSASQPLTEPDIELLAEYLAGLE